MRKRNGFVFVETMVTVVILASALLVIYTLFNNVLVKEHRRAYFDDPIYVYRTNYLTLIFEEILKEASTTPINPGEYINFGELLTLYEGGTAKVSKLKMFTCNNDIFDLQPEEKARCQQFFLDNQIFRIYISTSDLSYIDTCAMNNSNSSECVYYNGLNKQARQYFRQLPYVPGSEGYYIIFEYYDNGKDGVCSNENCMHQYGSVKYGGLTNVIDLSEDETSQTRPYLISNMVRNGSFENDFTNFTFDGVESTEPINVISRSNKKFGVQSAERKSGSPTNKNYISYKLNLIENHMYYYFLYASTNSTTDQSLKSDIWMKNGSYMTSDINSSMGWIKQSTIYTSSATEEASLSINFADNTSSIFVDGVGFVDLTQAFGAGNEPSLSWCNDHIEYFDNITFVFK